MRTNCIKNYDDMMTFLKGLRFEKTALKRRLETTGVSLFDTQIRAERKSIKSRIREINDTFKYYDKLIKKLTTFDRDVLLTFLSEFLASKTGEKYRACCGEELVYRGKSWCSYYYDLVYPVRDLYKFEIEGYNLNKTLPYDDFKTSTSLRYLDLPYSKRYTLMNSDGLLPSFEVFPELEDVCRKIINMKRVCPEMGNGECFFRVLKTVKTNKTKSIRNEQADFNYRPMRVSEEVKNFNDIINYLIAISKKMNALKEEYKRIKIHFYSLNKRDLRAQKEAIKNELDYWSGMCSYYNSFVRNATTFERGELASFLAKYFTLMTGERYTLCGVRDCSESRCGEDSILILSETDKVNLQKNMFGGTALNLNDALRNFGKVAIALGSETKYSLLEDADLKSQFSDFPEIMKIAQRIVDIKLVNPNLEGQEVLECIINDLNRQYNRSIGTNVDESKEKVTKAMIARTLINIRKALDEKPSDLSEESLGSPSTADKPRKLSKSMMNLYTRRK